MMCFHLPNEVLAMRTERWLLEKSGNKSMILNVVYVFLFQSSFTTMEFIIIFHKYFFFVSHFLLWYILFPPCFSFIFLICCGVVLAINQLIIRIIVEQFVALVCDWFDHNQYRDWLLLSSKSLHKQKSTHSQKEIKCKKYLTHNH